MTERIEYGSKDAADAARDRHSEYLCSDDDRRLKTVAWAESGTPEWVLEQERLEAADSRDDGGDDGGQVALSDTERDGIDFSDGRANVLHARSVKGIAQSEGVEDWTSYYDPTLTVDEHREVMADAARESGSRTAEESVEEKAGRAARAAQSSQCDHARGHCENGDPEACEFLQQSCGYDDDEVSLLLDDQRHANEQDVLVTVGGDEYPEMEVTPEVAGALRDSWTGYKAGMGQLDDALTKAREAVINARQAWRAINRIREANGQEPMHPDRLHTLLDALDTMPDSIPEVRTLDHFTQTETADEQADEPDQFATEQQGTLGIDTDAEQVAEEKQVTLAGGDEAGNEVAPKAWRQKGTTWTGGPHKIALDSHQRGKWNVKLTGPAGPLDLATNLPDPTVAETVAVGITERVQPDEVTGHNADATLQEAAAAAKSEALPDDEGGLMEYA
ncbi:hypothetical protein [Haloarcula marismortui]|uniref:Uncharacterized protein n=2 Tax=Haloarcula marismortui (strain ATCC 43049 / DSM 3752 / JCM 8966 / VKM B-1809) TaxID=272569 RepID=A0A4P8JWH8_HALMA|nr:hypothetical protein [Haloarcula marismortui]QCP90406.1 hypothetical protein E6P14_05865 [Haloarcula marismortui ATCC 43049]